jgi:hypothetical protein
MKKTAKIAAWTALASIALLVTLVLVWLNRPVVRPTPPPMMAFFIGPASFPPGPPDLERRVFLDANATAPAQVLGMLARTIPCSLKLDPRVQRPVTLRVSNVTARTALSAICESIGCRWQLADATLRVDPAEPPPPIPQGEVLQQKLRTPLADLDFKRVPFRDALSAIARQSGIDLIVEKVDPKTPVTVDVSGEPPLQALMKVVRAAGWNYTGSTSVGWQGDRPRIRFTPKSKLE